MPLSQATAAETAAGPAWAPHLGSGFSSLQLQSSCKGSFGEAIRGPMDAD